MAKQYDLVVLGAGNAGQAAAGAARKAGWTVAIVEALDVGGVCPNRGCVPKKVLVAAAEALDTVQRAGEHAIAVNGDVSLDWQQLFDRKESFVRPLPGYMEDSLASRGIDLVRGRGVFVSPDEVDVAGTRLRGKAFVLATGSRPRPLPFEGADLLWTSDDILSMTRPPKSVVFVGAGVIAFEFAHVLARVGTKVTMLEALPRPLPRADADAVAALVEHSRERGIDIRTDVRVNSVKRVGDQHRVVFEQAGETVELDADRIVNGAGRVPNLDNLDLEKAGISVERGRIELDEHLRSKDNPRVWVAGDALPTTPQLSPVATYEGRLVGHNLLNPDDLRSPDYSSLPSAVYAIPTLAQVGLTEAEAAARGLDVEVKVNDMRSWISARTYNEQAGFSKVLYDRESRQIVGAHMLGHGAGDVIHIFALAMRHGIAVDELASGLYAYPTFANDVKSLV